MINEFKGEYRFLSNFFLAPIKYNSQTYLTSEHLYQALKTINPSLHNAIKNTVYAGAAKRMGQEITPRQDWDKIKIRVMKHVVFLKFAQNIDLAKLLIATGDQELLEGNWWGDTFWGVNLKNDPIDGENHLGKILMKVRTFLQWLEIDKEF